MLLTLLSGRPLTGTPNSVRLLRLISRDGAAAARMAHNHEVPGSSPGPATKKRVGR